MLKLLVFDLTGTTNIPVQVTLGSGPLRESDIRATALAALHLRDVPHLTVEVRNNKGEVVAGGEGKHRGKIDDACVLCVRRADEAEFMQKFRELLKTFGL